MTGGRVTLLLVALAALPMGGCGADVAYTRAPDRRVEVRLDEYRVLPEHIQVSAGRVTLSLRRAGRSVLASGSAPVGDFMGLEAFQGSVPRYRALFTLDRFNRYAIRLPSVLGTHGLRVRVYQYSAGLAAEAAKSI